MKRKLLALAIMASLAGCGGGSSGGGSSTGGGDTGGGGGDTSGTQINGTATAPAGTVAQFEQQSLLQLAVNFLVPPAAAAITGLEPVTGATVELIRIDNNGDQVGDVLATTGTSLTGDYELTLPQGVDLSGDLIVRITGTNSTRMSAQVVTQSVNINPVSEFVLRKFIQQGVDLDQLVVNDVVKLSGQVEEFDLTAGADLSEMLNKLEQEVGEFVESQIAVVAEAPGDVTDIQGDYRSTAFSLELDDGDNDGYGTFWSEVWSSNFTFEPGSDNKVQITHSGEESAESGLNGTTVATANLWYYTDIDTETETFPGILSANGLLSIEGEFEEEIEGDHAWRSLPTVYSLQQVKDKALFVLLSQEAAVRYGTVDTNDDGEKDALDPDARRGDEVMRALEFFARKPSALTAADLSGPFGRVYFESDAAQGHMELRAETTTLEFHGDGTFDYSATAGHSLVLSASGTAYVPLEEAGSTEPAPVAVTAEGDVETLGEEADGFINDTYDFISLVSAEGANDQAGNLGKTLMVKLPTAAPEVSGKKYRLMFLGMHVSGTNDTSTEFKMSSSQLNTFLTMNSQTTASLAGKFATVEKIGGLGANNEITKEDVNISGLTVEIGSNGATKVTIPSDEGATVLDGFFNEDASLGIFTEHYKPTEGAIDELGLAILVEVTQ